MQDEEIDKIVREAASQHHPPYDDSAWDKMEQLLDQHLPVKKERDKKPFLFLLLFLLLGGGAFYAFIYPGLHNGSNEKVLAKQEKENTIPGQQSTATNTAGTQVVPVENNPQQKGAPLQNTGQGNVTTSTDNDPSHQSATTRSTTAGSDTKTSANAPRVTGKNRNSNIPASAKRNGASDVNNDNDDLATSANKGITVNKKARTKVSVKAPTPVSDTDNDIVKNGGNKNEKVVTEKEDPQQVATEVNTGAKNNDKPNVQPEKPVQKNKEEKAKISDSIAIAKNDKEEEKKKDIVTDTKKKEEKKKNGFGGNFGITVSAGTDLSYVDAGHLGKATFIYGAGLSYAIGKRVLVRTGFYVSHKIYSATPDQYNGIAYPYLDKVDGDCNVYEIPVSLSYNFGQKGKHNWFGSAGLSTFLMKKEAYKYTYKIPGGPAYYFDYAIDNQNKHYFSVLNLSAGYQYNLSKRVSFMAEPFVKLPLKGVGDGKIKLNSAGILLTATVRPFAKKK